MTYNWSLQVDGSDVDFCGLQWEEYHKSLPHNEHLPQETKAVSVGQDFTLFVNGGEAVQGLAGDYICYDRTRLFVVGGNTFPHIYR